LCHEIEKKKKTKKKERKRREKEKRPPAAKRVHLPRRGRAGQRSRHGAAGHPRR
jgi:hypothetical protein